MGINWNDVGQAMSDVQLEMLVTSGALVILLVIGIVIGKWAQRQQRATTRRPKRPIVGLRLRMRHGAWQAGDSQAAWRANFLQGMSTELFGAFVTGIFLGVVILITQQYQAIQNRKAELILQMGSPDNAFAIEAVRQLYVLGWLYDGTLQGARLDEANLQDARLDEANLQDAHLSEANLQRAHLSEANLQRAHLDDAKLQHADLWEAYLQHADLDGAKLQHADLRGAKLQHADLSSEANLQGADLSGAKLQHADLFQANLQDARLFQANLQDAHLFQADLRDADLRAANLRGAKNIEFAHFNENTLLPDAAWAIDENGKLLRDENGKIIYTPESYWTPEPETDMTRYTNPEHKDQDGNSDFWEPEWVREQD